MERKQVHLTLDQAKERLEYWKKWLRLSDWDIVVRVARSYDMPANTQGRCEWTDSRKEALIKLLDPTDWDPSTIYPQDMEVTLVHELIHLHLSVLADRRSASIEDTILEQAIHALAYSLVGLDRKSNA